MALLLSGGPAIAQPDDVAVDTLDVTMKLLPAGATVPDAVTRTIALPPRAADAAAAPGLDTANDARARRAQGLETAAEAREKGREFGQQMSQQAQEGRENAGRGQRPGNGNGPPDRPTPPAN